MSASYLANWTADQLHTQLARLNREADELEANGDPVDDIEVEIDQVQAELEERLR